MGDSGFDVTDWFQSLDQMLASKQAYDIAKGTELRPIAIAGNGANAIARGVLIEDWNTRQRAGYGYLASCMTTTSNVLIKQVAIGNLQLTYEALKNGLNRNLEASQTSVQSQLNNMSQGQKETVRNYIARYEALVTTYHDVHGLDVDLVTKKTNLLTGLNSSFDESFKTHVRRIVFADITTLERELLDEEDRNNLHKKGKGHAHLTTEEENDKSSAAKFKSKQKGKAFKALNKRKQKGGKNDKKVGKHCTFCNLDGHVIGDCRKKKTEDRKKYASDKGIICNWCQRSGHMSHDCKSRISGKPRTAQANAAVENDDATDLISFNFATAEENQFSDSSFVCLDERQL